MANDTKKTKEIEELSNSIADSAAKKLKIPSGTIDLAVFKELKRLVPTVMKSNSLLEQQVKNTENTNTLLQQHLQNKEQPGIKEEKSNPFAALSKDWGMAGTAYQGLKNLIKTIPKAESVTKLLEEDATSSAPSNLISASELPNVNPLGVPGKEKSELEAENKPVKVEIINFGDLAKIIPEAMKGSLKDLADGTKKGSTGGEGGEGGDSGSLLDGMYDLVAGTALMKGVRGTFSKTFSKLGKGTKNVFAKLIGKKVAEEVAEAAVKQGTKVVAQQATEAVAKEGIEAVAKEGMEAVAKEGVKTVAKETTEAVAEKGTKVVAQEATEAVAKKGTEAVAEKGTKVVTQEATEAVAKKGTEAVAEKGTKVVAQEVTESALKGTAEKALVEAAETASTKAAKATGSTVSKELLETAAVTTAAATAKEAAEKGLKKGLVSGLKGKIAAAIAAKVPKAFAGALGKSVPFLGAAIGGVFAIPKLLAGDYVGAAMEAGSGVGSLATAVPLTVASVARDVYQEVYGEYPEKDPQAGERFKEVKDGVMDAANDFLGKEKKPEPNSTVSPEKLPDTAPSIVPPNIKEATTSAPATTSIPTESQSSEKNTEIAPSIVPPSIKEMSIPESVNNSVSPETKPATTTSINETTGIDYAKDKTDGFISTKEQNKKDKPAPPAITPEPVNKAVVENIASPVIPTATDKKETPETLVAPQPIKKDSVTNPNVDTPAPSNPLKQNVNIDWKQLLTKTDQDSVVPLTKIEMMHKLYKQENNVAEITPKTENKTVSNSFVNNNSGKSEMFLEKIAGNTGGTAQNISNLIAGFNNLAKALERTLGETAKIPLVVNTNSEQSSSALPTSFYANAGNGDTGDFRAFVEGARALPA